MPAVAAVHLDYVVALLFLLLRLGLGHHTADGLERRVERLVVWVDGHLGQNGGDRFIDSALDQLGADAVLHVVADIALAHGGADGHGSLAVAVVLLAEFIHRSVNHAHLGGVAVDDGHLPSILNKISDHFGGFRHRGLLFREIGAQVLVTDCYDDSFFCHNPYLACLLIVVA